MADDEEFWNEDGLIDRDEDQYAYGQYDEEDFDSDSREQVGSREASTFKHSVSTGNGSPMKKASQQARRRPEAAGRSNFKQLYTNQKAKPRARPAEPKPRSQPVLPADLYNEKRFEIDSLRNEISDLKFDISKLKEENRTLKNQLRLQEKSLQKFDHDEANFGGYIKKFQDDLRVQQELSRRYREEKQKLEYIVKDRDVELERCRTEVSKLREVIAADGLDERSTLAAKLQSSEQERVALEKRFQDLQKHSDNLEKNHRFQLQAATKRHKESDKRSDQLFEENRKLRFELAEKTKMLEIQNIYSKRHANILRIPHYLPELGDVPLSEPHKPAVKFDPREAEDDDEQDETAEDHAENEPEQDGDDRQSDASARIKFDLEEEMDDANRPATNIQTAVQLEDDEPPVAAPPPPQETEKRPLSYREQMEVNAPQHVQEEPRPKSASRSSASALSRQQTDEQIRVDEAKKKRLLAALNAIDTTGTGASNSPTSNARESSHSSRFTNEESESENAKRPPATENGANWDFLTSMANGSTPSQPAKAEHHLLDSLEFGGMQNGGPLTKAKPPKPSGLAMANGPPKAKARLTPKEYSFVRAVESMHLGLSAAEEHSESNFNARFNQAEKNSKLLPRRTNLEKHASLSFNDDAEETYGAHAQSNVDSEMAARRALHSQYSAKSLDTDDVEEINI